MLYKINKWIIARVVINFQGMEEKLKQVIKQLSEYIPYVALVTTKV